MSAAGWDWYLALDWMEAAACRGRADVNFFPTQGDSDVPAKALCSICPVLRPCRQYALDHLELHGIWGGTSHRTRIRMRGGHR